MPRKYFPFYFTFREAGKTMPPRLRATFYEAIIDYATTGVDPVLPPSISGCWAVVKPLLDTSQKRYNAGVNGGRPSKNDSFGFPDSETNGLHKEKEKEKEKTSQCGKQENPSGQIFPQRVPPVFPYGSGDHKKTPCLLQCRSGRKRGRSPLFYGLSMGSLRSAKLEIASSSVFSPIR